MILPINLRTALVFAILGLIHTQGAEVPQMTALKTAYEAKKAALSQPVQTLNGQYRAALERLGESSRQSGNLEAVLAVKQAIQALDSGNPETPAKAPSVEALRNRYLQQKATLERQYAAGVTEATAGYQAQLTTLKANLTRAGDIDGAITVNVELEKAGGAVEALKNATPSSVPTEGAAPGAVRRINIQGKFEFDTIKIQKNTLWIQHNAYDLPADVKINTKRWNPEWTRDKSSSYVFDPPLAPIDPKTLSTKSSRGRTEIKVYEMPSEANGQTLTLKVEDSPNGVGEYTIILTW